MRYKYLFCILLLLLANKSNAQFYSAGQDPAIVKWLQIDTSFFKLVFPSEMKSEALEIANSLIKYYPLNTKSLTLKPIKVPILLHNRTIISNGFVTWAPKRSEWFTCPPQDLYAQPWLKQLSIHEYRHIVQVSQMYRGISKLISIPFGQMGVGGIAGTYLPRWFLEGDAVVMETALSESGRGRITDFSMDLKAQIIEKGKYNYNKSILGSYKDHVADPYTLGYQMVGYGRIKYGSMIWDSTLRFVARNPYMVVPFAQGFKKYSGINPRTLYDETLNSIDSIWKSKKENIKLTYFENKLSEKAKYYTNYRFPLSLNDSTIIAVKSGIDDIDRFVIIDSKGKERIVFTPGNYLEYSLSYAENQLVWSEVVPDIRWKLKNYAVIKTFNLLTKKVKILTPKGRYFAPDISNDGSKIAAVEVDLQNQNFLVIFNSKTGDIIQKNQCPDNVFITKPSWDETGGKLIMIAIGNSGKSILEFDSELNQFHYKKESIKKEISGASYFKNFILFTGNYNETSELIAFDTILKKFYKISSSEFGATDPIISSDSKNILYVNYSSNGYRVVSTHLQSDRWEEIDFLNEKSFELAELLSKQEKQNLPQNEFVFKEISVKSYSKIKNLFNFHSWAPLSIDANNQTFTQGISFMSHNLLSTSFITTGYEYLVTEKQGRYYFNYAYHGWFPVIDLKLDYKEGDGILINADKSETPFKYGETNLKAGFRIPLKFSKGKYLWGIQPAMKTSIINISHLKSTPDIFMKGIINSIDYQFYSYHLLKTGEKDIYPKWGQTLELNYRHTPFGIRNYGDILAAEVYLYLPSIFNHHGFIIYSGIQKKETIEKHYNFSDLILYPLGNTTVNNDKLWTVSSRYYMPLLYPDLSIGSLMYLKKIDVNINYAKSQVSYNKISYFLDSYSAEINSEMHIIRFPAPVNLGYRLIYLPNSNNYLHEILFGINFSVFGSYKNRILQRIMKD